MNWLRIPTSFKQLTRQIVYVPKHKPPNHEDFEVLKDFLSKHKNILILTGAGISTESGNNCCICYIVYNVSFSTLNLFLF